MDLLSGQPYWFYKNGIIHSYPNQPENTTTDVILMGGGITGALIANALVKAGLRVVMVEKRHIGLGSTSGSTALLQYEIDTDLHKLTELIGKKKAERCYIRCIEAISELHELIKKEKIEADFSLRKSLYYASSEKELPDLEKEFEARQRTGIDVEWWDKSRMRDTFPGIQKSGAIYSKNGGQVDALRLTHGLLQSDLKKGGLQIYDTVAVETITHHARSVKVTLNTGHEVSAKYLVIACGYESQEYLRRPVSVLHSTYAIISKPMPDLKPLWPDECLLWESARPYLYMRTTEDSRMLIGGKDEPFQSAGKRDRLLTRKRKQLESRAQKCMPHLPFTTDFSWCGTFAETPDGLPFIGTTDERSRTYFALGFGGNGILYSVIAAEIIRDGILQKKNEDAELFSFDRKSA
ncbi:NAD(P)/FAD-dependent oxidoreductase [Arundinibacter roseus]|uniref:FAD-binding oxidoreductase n=1 Tax=Arundinibacter roseus TaxID=2070510 RepID=A0A4R4JZW5_9BACT|nr:FAD-dependent oxidoreductase [Arundinibacter roseus]TDB60448.1 FAD-binding oxidoreductase [Arundinibacter roseus]